MLRRAELCPSPGECPEVLMNDPPATSESPPCAECPLELLETHLASPMGQVLGQVIDLDFALQAGVTVRLNEISYQEFLLLRFLAEERNKHQQEGIEQRGRQSHLPAGRSQFR
jgi:hypothetical protein